MPHCGMGAPMEQESSELSDQLAHLDQYGNVEQLALLLREIEWIRTHRIDPPEDWYTERIQKVAVYSELNWMEFSDAFENNNEYLHRAPRCILGIMKQLSDEWSTHSFSLATYHALLSEISNMWAYYDAHYVGGEKDEDVIELIATMTHMRT